MKLRIRYPDTDAVSEIDVTKQRVRIGRDSRCEVCIDREKYPKVSGVHAELAFKDGHTWLIHRSQSNSTVVASHSISEPLKIKHGDRFQLGFTGPEIEFISGSVVPKHVESQNHTILAGKASDHLNDHQQAAVGRSHVMHFPVENGGIIGRGDKAKFVLQHPHVSRRHAAIRVSGERIQVKDLGSSNGTYVNGSRITKGTVLTAGMVLDVGPFSLVFDGMSLQTVTRANNSQLDIAGLSFSVPATNGNRQSQLLCDVTFRVEPGEFIAVVGPSGSGKSTLLKLISGRNRPTTGIVSVNDRDLHQEFAALKEDLVVVPQAPTFHETLTVRQTVRFIAALRLPDDTSAEEIDDCVDASLATVGLQERADVLVQRLSGGQLKRLGLASELISDPSLLFLDEVTSGLDEQADCEMMQLFHGLAGLGKTIVCVTHNLSHIQDCCHKVMILTKGGRVAFYGTPRDALTYFDIGHLGEVYSTLEKKAATVWQGEFVASKYCDQHGHTEKPEAVAQQNPKPKAAEFLRKVGLKPVSQVLVLMTRYTHVWVGDKAAMLALLGQPCLVAGLLCLVFGDIPGAAEASSTIARQTEIRNLLFLLGVSSFWLGANTAAKEIVREREIYERERAFNLIPEAFLGSKLLVLCVLSLLQTLLLTVPVFVWCELPCELGSLFGVSLLLAATGTSLGLAISAHARSEEFAAAMVPVAVIPQIILGGVVANLDGLADVLAKTFATVFRGQQLYEYIIPETERIATVELPSLLAGAGTIVCQAVVFLVIAIVGTRRRHAE